MTISQDQIQKLQPAQRMLVEMELAKRNLRKRCVFPRSSVEDAVATALARHWCELVHEENNVERAEHLIEDSVFSGKVVRVGINVLPAGLEETHRILYGP